MEWMILPLKRYAEFSGRSRRKEFWLFALLNLLVYAVLGGLAFATTDLGGTLAASDPDDIIGVYSAMFSGVGILLGLWALAILIPSIAVSVRRLHDRDMSGWWYLGFIIGGMIPFIGIFASIAFIVIMALPGTDGANRFGPDPKGGAADASVFD